MCPGEMLVSSQTHDLSKQLHSSSPEAGTSSCPAIGEWMEQLWEWAPHFLVCGVVRAWGVAPTPPWGPRGTKCRLPAGALSSAPSALASLPCWSRSLPLSPCQNVLGHVGYTTYTYTPVSGSGWRNPRQCCRLGALVCFQSIQKPHISLRGNYGVRFLNVFSHGVWLWSR